MTGEVFVYSLLGAFPLLLIWLSGIVWCVMQYPNEQRRSVLAIAALLIFLFSRVTIPFLQQFLLNEVFGDHLAFGWRVFVGNMIPAIPHAIGFGLLIWAAVGPTRRNTVGNKLPKPSP